MRVFLRVAFLLAFLTASGRADLQIQSLAVQFGPAHLTPQPAFLTFTSTGTISSAQANSFSGLDPSLSLTDRHTVTITLSAGARPSDRNGQVVQNLSGGAEGVSNTGAFTQANLCNAWLGYHFSAGEAMWIQLSGLRPYSPYQIKLYACDPKTSGSVTFTDMTYKMAPNAGAQVIAGDNGTVTWTAKPAFTGDDACAVTLAVVTDINGTAVIQAVGHLDGDAASAILNGLVVTPNPASRFVICDTRDNMQGDNAAGMLARFELYKKAGAGAVRVDCCWADLEHDTDGTITLPYRQVYYGQTVGHISMKLSVSSTPPGWWYKANPGAKLMNSAGKTSTDMPSPFYTDAYAGTLGRVGYETTISTKLKMIFAYLTGVLTTPDVTLQNQNLLQNAEHVLLNFGHDGVESLYPPELGYGFYGPAAKASFIASLSLPPTTVDPPYYANNPHMPLGKWVPKESHYGPGQAGIDAANQVWGTSYASYADIIIPAPGAATVKSAGGVTQTVSKQFWNDLLSWYRDAKRDYVDCVIRTTRSQMISAQAKAGAGHIPRLEICLGGSLMSYPKSWDGAVDNLGKSDAGAKFMCDWEFLIDEASTYGLNAHYDGESVAATEPGEIAKLVQYIADNKYNVPFACENLTPANAEGTDPDTGKPALLEIGGQVEHFNQYGIDLVDSSILVDNGTTTTARYYDLYKEMCQKLTLYYTGPQEQNLPLPQTY